MAPKFFFPALFILLVFTTGKCTLETYEGDEPTTNISPYFTIKLTQGSTTAYPHVYFSKNNNAYSNAGSMFYNRSVSWIDFGQNISDITKVEITLLNNDLWNFAPYILPKNYNIDVSFVSPSQLSFTVFGIYKHISLEYNSTNTNSFKDSLLIFVGALDPPINKNDSNVLYFGPGTSSITGDINQKNGILQFNKETIYLSRGAWVYGKINVTGSAHGIKSNAAINILGNGILDGSYFNYSARNDNQIDRLPAIGADGNGWSRGFNINGLTCFNPSNWCVTCLTRNSIINGYKTIAWYYNNDGMGLATNTTMRNSFIRTNDDSIKLNCGGPQIVENNVIYQLYNGSPFQLGWNSIGCNNCVIRSNDIIHAEWEGYGNGVNQQPNDAVIDMDYGGWGGNGAQYNNVSFKDLRVDVSVGRIISLTFNSNSTTGVQMNNMLVKDVNIREKLSWLVDSNQPSQIINIAKSPNGKSYLNGLTFSNVSIMGNKVMNDSDWNLKRTTVNSNALTNVKYE